MGRLREFQGEALKLQIGPFFRRNSTKYLCHRIKRQTGF